MAKYTFQLPENMAKGKYLLKFKLVESSGENDIPIDLGLQKSSFNSEGFVDLGSVTISISNQKLNNYDQKNIFCV